MQLRSPTRRLARTGAVLTLLVAAGATAGCSPMRHPTPTLRTSTATAASKGSTTSRGGTSSGRAAANLPPITIAAVGDTMLGNTPNLPSQPDHYLDAVKAELRTGAQIVFGNLEGTLTTVTGNKCAGAAAGACYAFRVPPGYVQYLKNAGFTILSNANPHSYDFGAAGQQQTVRTIHDAGLAQTGLPGQITVVTAHGVRVAFVAFAPYSDTASLLDIPAARALIKQAAAKADVVVVYMHAGAEGAAADHVTGNEENFLGEDRGNPQAFAHMAIQSGASLVIASGPHVLRGMEFYRHHLIAYSLGNFASYDNFATEGNLGKSAILHVTLSATGVFEQARIYPVQFAAHGRPVPGGDTISFVSRLSVQDFGASAARIAPSGIITAP